MSVFEAKLNSIAGVPNYDAAALPDTAAPSNPTPASAPASAPAASSTPVSSGAPAVVPPPPQATVSAPEPSPVGPMVKDHPDYAPFFKMLKVGVPQPVIVGKMSAIGLNPALLDTPDAPAPSDGGSGDID
jgi:hypothetical protein